MTRALALLVAASSAAIAQAAPFTDPMRPPSILESSLPAAASGPRLESVLIAPDRRIAVISGQQVTVGGKVGAAEVVRITESEVVIRSAEGTATLKLVPQFATRTPIPQERTSK
jgi:MSHA biogenesis protein MshK